MFDESFTCSEVRPATIIWLEKNSDVLSRMALEMEAKLHGFRARSKIVSSAERGQEIVERNLVGYVDRCQPKAPLVLVTTKNVVISHGNVEQVTSGNTGRVLVIILGARSGNANSR